MKIPEAPRTVARALWRGERHRRRELAQAVKAVFESAQQSLHGATDSPLINRITDHLGCPLTEIPNVALHLPAFEHANLQRGVDAYLAAHSPDAVWFGIAGSRHFNTVIDMLAEAATNRSYQLGAVERPGRIDLAAEVPKPDAECRERLLRLYARATSLDLPQADEVVAATEGVTASFIKELVRRAVLQQVEEGTDRMTGETLNKALAELMDERQTLTRSILGCR